MNNKMLVVALGLCTLSMGCQKSQNSAAELMDQTSSAVECVPGSQKLNTEGLQIVGAASVQKGEVVSYKLNQSVACDSSEEVIWKVSSNNEEGVVGDSLQSTYKAPGHYIVTAQVAEVPQGQAEASRKAQALAASARSGLQTLATTTVVVSDRVVLVAPQVSEVGEKITAQLAIPADTRIYEAIYNFGDGSANVSSLTPVEHTYASAGNYTISVTIQGNNGSEGTLTQAIQVLEPEDEVCNFAAAISGATEVEKDQLLNLSIYMPACLAAQIGDIKWQMGDGTSYDGASIGHRYAAVGEYEVTAVLHKASDNAVLFTLKHNVKVVDGEGGSTGNPNACSVQGQTRDSQSAIYKERLACGTDGYKENSYRDSVKDQCQMVAGQLVWNEVSRTKDLVSEGSCQGQSCVLPDGSKLADGGSKVFYSSQTPAGTCAEASQTRSCANGVLSGSSTHTQTQCFNSCGTFGVHGTVKAGVVIGEVSIPKVCKFGEAGIVDIFNQTATQTCNDGTVVNSNTQQGSIKTAGVCPTYKYSATEEFSTCSADCGGSQSRVFKCTDGENKVVDNARCEGQVAPTETRVCDANPEAVKREETSVATEDANSSQQCPANQIGVVVSTREVTTKKVYACVDHKVQLADTQVTYGAWATEKYCRDYVAHRCNHDSLSNSQAAGRYSWMVKCQDQLPLVKEFLENFANVKAGSGRKLSGNASARNLYASFMNRAYSPEKPWIAPTSASAPCTMPSTAYIATVCVSSCATPEQLVLAQEAGSAKMKYVPFIDALNQKYGFVASLQSAQSMGSKAVSKTKVDQWVTEMLDTDHNILIFKMKSGREIKVTTNHTLVDSKGYMRVANEFKAGDDLVQLGGVLDQIVSITPAVHSGKVYNVFVQSAETHKNILVLNGYLNGSAFFQNDGAKELNKSLFRKTLIRGAF